jgi:signal peptidase II
VLRIGLSIAGLTLVLDQISKWWALHALDPLQPVAVIPFLNLVLVWNRGVSFGLFDDGGSWTPWLLKLVALIIVAGLVWWLRRTDDRYQATALGLIIGGAIGNVIDRLVHGAVVDFIDVHAAGYHWPAFNVADSAICVGAVLLVFESLLAPGRKLEGQHERSSGT